MKIKYFHYLLIAPVQVLLLITIGIPALYILWLSFQNSKFGNDIIFSGTPKGVNKLKIGDKLEGYIENEKILNINII